MIMMKGPPALSFSEITGGDSSGNMMGRRKEGWSIYNRNSAQDPWEKPSRTMPFEGERERENSVGVLYVIARK